MHKATLPSLYACSLMVIVLHGKIIYLPLTRFADMLVGDDILKMVNGHIEHLLHTALSIGPLGIFFTPKSSKQQIFQTREHIPFRYRARPIHIYAEAGRC